MIRMFIFPDRSRVLFNQLEGPKQRVLFLCDVVDGGWGMTIGEPRADKLILVREKTRLELRETAATETPGWAENRPRPRVS